MATKEVITYGNENFDTVFAKAEDYVKILLLLLKAGLSQEDIAKVPIKNIEGKGVKINDKLYEIPFEILSGYLTKKGRLIKLKGFFFPSLKQAAPMAAVNILAVVDREAKKHNLRYHDLNLPQLRKSKTAKVAPIFKAQEDIVKWLNE